MLSNYFKQLLVSITREIIQTILTNYYLINYSKQFLQTFTRDVILNNSYKLLSQMSFQTMLSNYFKSFFEKSFKQFLQPIITEIIPNNS